MYTEEELKEYAKGVFNDDKTSPSIYADKNGTFRNSKQYEALSKEEKKEFPYEFKNPNVKASAQASDPETEKKLADALKEIERLSGLKSVKEAKSTIVAKDAEISDLKKQLETALAALPKD